MRTFATMTPNEDKEPASCEDVRTASTRVSATTRANQVPVLNRADEPLWSISNEGGRYKISTSGPKGIRLVGQSFITATL